MGQIENVGTYRGSIVDHGISASTGGFPQWVPKLLAMEKYNFDTEEWEDYSQYEDNEIQAYLVIIGAKGENLNCKQTCLITGWDGSDLQVLSEMNLEATGIQFRVEENTYNDKTRLQVAWVDEYDAKPGGTVRKATPDEIKALNAKFKKYLKPTKVVAATAKPVDAPATPKKKSTKKGTVVNKTDTPAPVEPQVTQSAPAAPSVPAEEAPMPKSAIPEGKCTQAEAYDEAYAAKTDDVTDEKFNEFWFAAIESVTGTKTYDGVEPEQWHHIKNNLMEKTAKF